MTDENMLALTAQSTRRSDTQGAAESRHHSGRPASSLRRGRPRRVVRFDRPQPHVQPRGTARLIRGWTFDGIPGSVTTAEGAREVRAQPPHPQRVVSSSPGGLLPRGPHQNRTRRFPPSGSSADVAHGDAPQIRTRIRGTGRGYRSNNATNLGQGSTTFRISGDMSPAVNAPVMGPFESSRRQHIQIRSLDR